MRKIDITKLNIPCLPSVTLIQGPGQTSKSEIGKLLLDTLAPKDTHLLISNDSGSTLLPHRAHDVVIKDRRSTVETTKKLISLYRDNAVGPLIVLLDSISGMMPYPDNIYPGKAHADFIKWAKHASLNGAIRFVIISHDNGPGSRTTLTSSDIDLYFYTKLDQDRLRVTTITSDNTAGKSSLTYRRTWYD